MSESVINYELLDFTMKYIKTNPEHHNQREWFSGELEVESGTHVADMDICGTAGCFAGWAAIFSGWHQVRPHIACFDCNMSRSEFNADDNIKCGDYAWEHTFDMRADLVVNHEGEIKSMQSAAMQELGFDNYQASAMFAGTNSRERLDSMVTRLHEGKSIL